MSTTDPEFRHFFDELKRLTDTDPWPKHSEPDYESIAERRAERNRPDWA